MKKPSKPVTRRQLVRAITRLVRANDAHSWRGAGDPKLIPDIELKLELATLHVNDLIRRLPIEES